MDNKQQKYRVETCYTTNSSGVISPARKGTLSETLEQFAELVIEMNNACPTCISEYGKLSSIRVSIVKEGNKNETILEYKGEK